MSAPRPGIPTLAAGTLAYVETLRSGLIPCKVLGIRTTAGPYPHAVITLRVTATRYAYRRGEILERVAHVVPRRAVHTRGGRFIVYPFNVQADSGPGAVSS